MLYGCGAHALNLLGKDLENKAVTDKAIQVIKYFRNTHLPGAWLRASGNNKLILPCDLLDPRYVEIKLTADEESSALDFASELHPELLSYIMKFWTKREPFLSRHFDTATDVHPSDWWKLARVPEEISKICRKILACSPSTGSLERP